MKMKKQIKYLCDSGSKLQTSNCNEVREGMYERAKQSLEGIIVREVEGQDRQDRQEKRQGKDDRAMTWGHVKRNHCGICQPWYRRLEQYRD
jgi:hypothetical protein